MANPRELTINYPTSIRICMHCMVQTKPLENIQRHVLQIIFGNSPYNLSFGTLQLSSICDRHRELSESLFRQIVCDESHVLRYLLPAKYDSLFPTDYDKQTFPLLYTRTTHYRNSFLRLPYQFSKKSSTVLFSVYICMNA